MIPVNRPDFGIKDIFAFIRGHFKDNIIPTFEGMFSQYIGMKYDIFTSSCRSALYLTYKSLKIEGNVIVSPLTCTIAILPLICSGLRPHFVDLDPQTYNMDPEKINECITKNTSAIQVIHLAGNPCDMKPIMEIADDHNLIVVEDCAQGLGAEYYKRKVGSLGDVSCFSFTKNMYGIGGGMITTNDKNLILKVDNFQQRLSNFSVSLKYYRLFRDSIERVRGSLFGDILYNTSSYLKGNRTSEGYEDCNFLKSRRFIYNPTNVEAAMSLSQFDVLDKMIEKRVKNAVLLTKRLEKAPDVKIQKTTNDSKHVFMKYMIETKYNCIDIIRKLHKKKIEAKHLTHTHKIAYQDRLDRNPFYAQFNSIKNCENYLRIHDNIVSLPISSNMQKREVIFIAERLREIVENS